MAEILFVLELFPPHIGGVETQFDNLTKALAKKGFDVTVFTSRVEGSKPFEIDSGRKIIRKKIPFRHAFAAYFPFIARLFKKTDLIHTTSYVAAGAGYIAHLSDPFIRKPVVLTVHEIWHDMWFEFENPVSASINWFLESLMCLAYKNDAITCPSEYTKKALIARGIPKSNIHVIPHGIEHDIFNKNVKGKKFEFPSYLFFGRPGISKGIPYLLKAVPVISQEIPNSKLVLMVSKRQKKEYNAMMTAIKKLGIKNKIVFIPSQKERRDVARILKSVDTVVIPSLTEGFCFNAAETQAVGTPLIASRAGSLPEVVKGGLFVEPRSSEAIADAVIKLFKNKNLRNRLGNIGSQYVKKYTWEKAVKEYIKIYDKLIQ